MRGNPYYLYDVHLKSQLKWYDLTCVLVLMKQTVSASTIQHWGENIIFYAIKTKYCVGIWFLIMKLLDFSIIYSMIARTWKKIKKIYFQIRLTDACIHEHFASNLLIADDILMILILIFSNNQKCERLPPCSIDFSIHKRYKIDKT